MAQRPKPEVREAIVHAAALAFCEHGFEDATLIDIVNRAGTSIGNLYKYYPNNNELFSAFLPPSFPKELTSRLSQQVRALHAETNAFELDHQHPYRQASERLLAFSIAHRERVVFLLLRAKGSKYEPFAADIVRRLVGLAVGYAKKAHPTLVFTPARRRALVRIYRGFVLALGAILVEERTEKACREAVALLTRYHLSGLAALFAHTASRSPSP
jgi:AcrR family transcriptional regulator